MWGFRHVPVPPWQVISVWLREQHRVEQCICTVRGRRGRQSSESGLEHNTSALFILILVRCPVLVVVVLQLILVLRRGSCSELLVSSLVTMSILSGRR
jgi:hypothetical protein